MTAFLITNLMLGIGLAMDAFSVSVANGIREGKMGYARKFLIAGTYALFQTVMPIVGWICVKTAVDRLIFLQAYIPRAALIILVFIGGKMIYESIGHGEDAGSSQTAVGYAELAMQGIATSIDALSLGFTFALHGALYVISSAVIIGAVTFIICLTGLALGRAVGLKLTRYSGILGGIVLIAVGISIYY